MTELSKLEQKIEDLEKRLKAVEDRIGKTNDSIDDVWTDELFEMAKAMVIKHNKASVIFLQRKLMIDIHRAIGLLKKLEEAGIVGPADGLRPREVRVKR